MGEYTEDCCFNDVRDLCPLNPQIPCSCACHETQVTIHGRYGRGPMPVEFRDALVELTRLVVEAVDRGELGQRRCPHGHADCCGHHDLEDMPVHHGGECVS